MAGDAERSQSFKKVLLERMCLVDNQGLAERPKVCMNPDDLLGVVIHCNKYLTPFGLI